MNPPSPMVFLVDDHAVVLKVVGAMLRAHGFEVATFSSCVDFLAAYDPALPGCLVLDISMPDLNGLELQHALAERGSHLPIIFLTSTLNVPMCVQAMKHGAVDYFIKPAPNKDLCKAIHRALEGDTEARQKRAGIDEVRARIASLTPREREVLAGVVAGQLNKQIAADLGTAEKTIKVHRGRVMQKMRVVSVAELVRLVEQCGEASQDGAAGA